MSPVESFPAGSTFEHPNVLLRVVGCLIASLGHIEPALVRGKRKTIGAIEVCGSDGDFAAVGIEAIQAGGCSDC